MKQILLVFCLIASVPLTQAQTAKTTAAKSSPTVDAELVKERRARARALLVSLSSDARMFQDQTLRARSLARIADALWQVDAEQGRLLFRKAWDAAEVADQESDKKLQEEIKTQRTRTGGGYAVSLPPNVQREVLRLAARHDRVLGEEFLEKLRIERLEAAASATVPGQRSNRLPEALSQRLGVARELIQAGEMERALQFADPALGKSNN
jgi:hypothetical protein